MSPHHDGLRLFKAGATINLSREGVGKMARGKSVHCHFRELEFCSLYLRQEAHNYL